MAALRTGRQGPLQVMPQRCHSSARRSRRTQRRRAVRPGPAGGARVRRVARGWARESHVDPLAPEQLAQPAVGPLRAAAAPRRAPAGADAAQHDRPRQRDVVVVEVLRDARAPVGCEGGGASSCLR